MPNCRLGVDGSAASGSASGEARLLLLAGHETEAGVIVGLSLKDTRGQHLDPATASAARTNCPPTPRRFARQAERRA